jgi:LysR family transcriptional regulator, nitrogen assimilation regulatory protein
MCQLVSVNKRVETGLRLERGRQMNLRQIRYFLKIAELRSFTRASDVLNIAQPALSRQIRMLEEELGQALFSRSGKGVALTETGQALKEKASALVQQFDRLRDEILDQSSPQGHLNVGLPPAIGQFLSLTLIDDFCRRHPDVQLHVKEGISLDLISSVQEGRLDCAIVVLDDATGITAEHLLRETLFLVGPASAGLELAKSVTLQEARGKPLILTNRMNNFRIAIETAFARDKIPIRIVADSNSTSMISGLVAKGTAYSILPYCAICSALDQKAVSASPIEGLYVDWALIHPSPSELTPFAKLFRSLLIEHIARKLDDGSWTGATLPTRLY